MTKNLDALAARIEQVALDPDRVSAPLSRILRPILARLGVEPDLRTARAIDLIEQLRVVHAGGAVDQTALDGALDAAKNELDTNVSAVERACVVNEQPMVAAGAWLRRMYEVLVRAERAIVEQDASARAMLASTDPVRLLPPLVVRAVPHTEGAVQPAPARRLVELELASVDRLLDAAGAEEELLGRKRRLLEAARRMLLDASASMPLDERGCAGRLDHIAGKIARIDRLEASGLRADTALTHQLRQAISRGERDRAYAALSAIHGAAVDRGDERTLELASGAMRVVCGAGGTMAPEESLRRSAREMFGLDLDSLTRRAYETARRKYGALAKSKDMMKRELCQQAAQYFSDDSAAALTSAAIAVDGCFDVGGAMIPTRVVEHETVVRAVRYPTADLALLPAVALEEVQDAIIEDPRLLVLDLAAGRLLARRYIAHEVRPVTKTVMRGEVRAYVLDGSGSMVGPRARMRDAILASELCTLRRRMTEHAKMAQVVLFYRYFTDAVEPSHRVDDLDGVDAALREVLGSIRNGGTNIEGALVATLTDIAAAKRSDPHLSRAQVIVVTDGLASVDEAHVSRVRETIGDLPIALSVIALGEQNEALRTIVAKQRAKGEHAFYHFISDEALRRIASGEVDPSGAVHPPPVNEGQTSPEMLASQIGELVDEIATRARSREVEALESLDDASRARAEVGVAEADLSESEKARARALYRDRASLERQFDRWFPKVPAARTDEPTARGDDVEAATVLLSTVAEMLAVVGGSELARMADAIDLLERLLPDGRLTPARYHAVIAEEGASLAAPLAAVRAAALASTSTS